MRKALSGLALMAGLAWFGWFVYRAGPAEIGQTIARLGWSAPLIFIPYLLVYLLDNLGWKLSFGAYAATRPSYGVLFRVRWAGESVNYVVPSAYVGGEAVKVWLLHRRGVPGLTAGTSVVASKTCQTLAQVLFIALGAILALGHLEPASGARVGMLVIALAAWVGVALLFLVQWAGLFTVLTRVASWFPPARGALERHRDHWLRLDRKIYRFYHGEPWRFMACTLVYFAGWVADVLEILCVAWLMGHPISWTEALAIEAFIGVAKALGIFVPAALGVQESGVALLFHLLHLPAPMGAAYAIVRRGRELAFALVGGWLLCAEGVSWKDLTRRGNEPSRPSGLLTEP